MYAATTTTTRKWIDAIREKTSVGVSLAVATGSSLEELEESHLSGQSEALIIAP